jgi:hypothetical protein
LSPTTHQLNFFKVVVINLESFLAYQLPKFIGRSEKVPEWICARRILFEARLHQ